MRLIPGKSKVQVELFKGISIGDMIVGGVSAILILFMLTSTIPGKIYIAIGLLVIAVVLLARLDTEPNYLYLLHILRHFGYRRRYEKVFSDDEILRMQGDAREQVAFEGLFENEEETEEESEIKADRKARKKAEKAERKADNKILRSKEASEEEKNAIWRKRAEQSAAKKREKAEKERNKSGDAFSMSDIMAFTGIHDNFIDYNGKYYGIAIEIPPVEFRFFSQSRRSNSIENGLGRVLRSVPAEYAANIVKIERPIVYDSYLKNEYGKLEDLRASYEKGMISEEELQSRVEVLYDRINDLRYLCYDQKVVQPFYYLVLFDSDRQQLQNNARAAIDNLQNGEMAPHRLNNKELAVFLKYTNQIDFDERDIDKIEPADYAAWAMPQSAKMKARTTIVNDIITHNFRIVNYPTVVPDAWLASVLSLPATKVVIKCTPMDRSKAIRSIDHSLQELRGQFRSTGVDSKRIELQEHIQTLGNLLAMLQGDNESLLEVNIYVTAYDINLTRETPGAIQPPPSALTSIANFKRVVRRTYQEQNMRLNNMEFDQVNAFIGSQISAWDPMRGKGRGIPSNSIAAAYPWVFAHVSDRNGIKLGSESGVPVFIDFFRRDSERVNSNMVIVGKSGSGKSYATKSVLTNLAADDSKIFILDPENEYTELAENLHGKFINVGNAQHGRLNPFHIITALDDDESDGATVSGSYATHLQFLEEFFRQILPDCDKDAMEYLNALIDRMYTDMGITTETDLSRLRPEDYPTFDDLYDHILSEFQSTDNEYIRTMLRTLMNYIAKFSTGGRNANIWNGPSTITTDENFTVFNFQSLLANRNGSIANAQMLLVLKYIDNEIIKNRDYNTKYKLNRKVVVVIDEAHVFIDTKYPIALDFMFQLAKRIRKYNGMQIVITQNIKDFVGSEEIARKSTAIINACQYSFIFALSPNDMGDLCTLYEKAGGINENEQEQIIQAPRGQAFTIMSPTSRSTFKVEVPEDVVAMFREKDYQSRYFRDEDGAKNWEDFIADSRDKRAATVTQIQTEKEETNEEQRPQKKQVTFLEITEEELVAATAGVEKKMSAAVDFAETDDFPEIPDFPDSPEEFAKARETTVPMVAGQTAAAVVPQMIVQAPAASGETEKILSELLSKLSYESMLAEIRRGVREEMDREKEALGITPAPALSETEAEKGKAAEQEAVSEESSEPASLGSIFNSDAMAEAMHLAEEEAAATAESDAAEEEASDSGFDIMALLTAEAERLGDVSPIDMMETYDEMLIEITLEELIAYNGKH